LQILPAVSVVAVMGGCKLIDQRTFDPTASRPPKPYIPPAAPVKPVPALVTIQAGTQQSVWQETLAHAVKSALARKSTVIFTVTSIVPGAATPQAQRLEMAALVSGDAKAVATAIVADGAQPSQVEITAITDSSVTSGVIKVYVH